MMRGCLIEDVGCDNINMGGEGLVVWRSNCIRSLVYEVCIDWNVFWLDLNEFVFESLILW